MVAKACLRRHIKDPYEEKLRDAIRNCVESYSMSFIKALSGLVRLVKEMFRDVTHMETVQVPEEFFDQAFIRHLRLGTEETSTKTERPHALHANRSKFRFDGTRHKRDSNIYTCGAIKYLTDLKNHMIVNLERFMIRTMFALNPDLSRQGMWAIINEMRTDRQHEQQIEFFDERTSRRSRNEASVIRPAIKEHRAVLGQVDRAERVSDMKKDVIPSSCAISCS